MTLRRRVLLGVLVVATVLVATNLALTGTFRGYLLDRIDNQLVDVASRPYFRDDRGAGGPPGPRPDERTFSEYFIAVGDPSRGTLTRLSSALDDDSHPPPRLDTGDIAGHATALREPARPFTVSASSGDGRWRLLVVRARQGPQVAVVGIELGELDATVGRIRLVQGGSTLLVAAALGLMAWWVLRLGIHPLEDMARTADAIAAGDLSHRVDAKSEATEAGRLGVALNTMLTGIEDAFRAREASEGRVRRFAADASHELRTPLTSIQGYAELWRTGALATEEQRTDAMRRIEQEAQRMSALVEDLLSLARLDQGRPMERGPVRLDHIAGDGVRDALAVEPGRPISIVAEPVTVDGDDGRLRQVVANLLANARVHTPEGTPIVVTVRAQDGHARLEVADAGPGMDAEVAGKVFERFFRADVSRARNGGGTGLGLAIVSAVADAHGGRASVHSMPGRGSTFTVDLPLGQTPVS